MLYLMGALIAANLYFPCATISFANLRKSYNIVFCFFPMTTHLTIISLVHADLLFSFENLEQTKNNKVTFNKPR